MYRVVFSSIGEHLKPNTTFKPVIIVMYKDKDGHGNKRLMNKYQKTSNLTVFDAEETLHLLSQLKNHLSNVF